MTDNYGQAENPRDVTPNGYGMTSAAPVTPFIKRAQDIETERAGGFRMVGEQAPLFAALAKARAAFGPVLKTKKNPFFNSNYADLSDVLDACMPALCENGLFLCQIPTTPEADGAWKVFSLLTHSSGAFWEWSFTVQRAEWQKFGSALTYGRRYVDSAVLGVASEPDDDGNSADDKTQKSNQAPPKAAPKAQPVAAPVPPKAAVSAPVEPSSAGGAAVLAELGLQAKDPVEMLPKGSPLRDETKKVIDMPPALITDDQMKEISALLHSKAWPDSAGKPFREKSPKGVERWAIVNSNRANELCARVCSPGVGIATLSTGEDAYQLLQALRDMPDMPTTVPA